MLTTEHADMYAIFGPTNVGIHGVQVAVELGNGHDALRRVSASTRTTCRNRCVSDAAST